MLGQPSKQFWSALRASRLLPVAELDQLAAELAEATFDPAGAAETLVQRKILTSFQAKRLLAGEGEALVLGPYKILDRIGAGGMGQVYKAEHLVMNRVVAIKVVAATSSKLADDLPAQNNRWADSDADLDPSVRFSREIRVSAQLSHPNIVTTHDAGQIGSLHYLVMEYVGGTDLDRLVTETGPLPVTLACECIRQAALGLQYMHEQGLVHRDIKPANLLLRTCDAGSNQRLSEPIVKILDLGLARFRNQRGPLGAPPQHSGPESGLGGTPDFLAPELAQDWSAADTRSDLYSLGCTFYYLLTGQPPFAGGTWTEKLVRHCLEPAASVQELRPEVPVAVAAILQRLLAKKPEERYAEPATVASELGAWVSSQTAQPQAALNQVLAGTVDTHLSVDCATWSEFGTGLRPPNVAQRSVEQAAKTPAEPVAVGPEPAPSTGAGSRWLPWPTAILAAAVLGLFAAWMVRETWPQAPLAASPNKARSGHLPFHLEGSAQPYASLVEAVAVANDGDTITIRGNGPFSSGPLDCRGKALQVRAGEGARPRIRFVGPVKNQPWRPSFITDRSLTLAGIEFSQEVLSGLPLIVSADAPLHLLACHFNVPQASGVIVSHNPSILEIVDCHFQARSLALCVECASSTPSTMRLAGNDLRLTEPGGAALSLWSPEARSGGEVRLELEGNSIAAGRILALKNLRDRMRLVAEKNQLHFHAGLLTVDGKAQTSNDLAEWLATSAHMQ